MEAPSSSSVLFSSHPVDGVQVIEFSRSDVTDAAYIKRLGDEIYGFIKTLSPPHIVVDLSNVGYLSSATLGMLIAVNRVVLQRRGQLRVCGVNEEIAEVFQITCFDRLVRILETADDAVASIDVD